MNKLKWAYTILSFTPFIGLVGVYFIYFHKFRMIPITITKDIFILSSLYLLYIYFIYSNKKGMFRIGKITFDIHGLYWLNFLYIICQCVLAIFTEVKPLKYPSGEIYAIHIIGSCFKYLMMFVIIELAKGAEIVIKNINSTSEFAKVNKLEQLKSSQVTPTVAEVEKPYHPTERESHLQAIATLTFKLAESKPSAFKTTEGKVKFSPIASVLEKEANELFTNPKKADSFKRRISEAIKAFSGQ